jgi:hypothetical protein
MRIEGDSHRTHSLPLPFFNRPPHHGGVPEMYTVEVPEGDHDATRRRIAHTPPFVTLHPYEIPAQSTTSALACSPESL